MMSRLSSNLRPLVSMKFSAGPGAKIERTNVPLVFVHGMKGSHLASPTSRHWLSLSGLLNFPPRIDHHPSRDLSLPLTYEGTVQDRGRIKEDGLVENILEITSSIGFFPFYGHISQFLTRLNMAYTSGSAISGKHLSSTIRPTACFVYDWRRSLDELADDFHDFCCQKFPDQPVQILAHSMGGLISMSAMRMFPDKYQPGAVMAGVPFGTGIQFLQDMHCGYYTELGRCRQFLPQTQFTFSSHWCFFPPSSEALGDAFVDVTDEPDLTFEANVPSIGKDFGNQFREDPVKGKRIEIDFYNVDEWEKHKIGIFDKGLDQATLELYRNHMRIQTVRALEFRNTALRPQEASEEIPPLVVGASNNIPTINQILRRTNGRGGFDYDYMSGRSVPGDGRINFCGAFPLVRHKAVTLQCVHTKQFLWEDHGGELGTLMSEVDTQITEYLV